jgi:hypothetical protein
MSSKSSCSKHFCVVRLLPPATLLPFQNPSNDPVELLRMITLIGVDNETTIAVNIR